MLLMDLQMTTLGAVVVKPVLVTYNLFKPKFNSRSEMFLEVTPAVLAMPLKRVLQVDSSRIFVDGIMVWQVKCSVADLSLDFMIFKSIRRPSSCFRSILEKYDEEKVFVVIEEAAALQNVGALGPRYLV